MKSVLAASVTCSLLCAAPASAQSATTSYGLGYASASQTAFTLRWHSEPRPEGFSWAAGLLATSRGSLWVGAGASLTLYPGGGNWFLRGAFMPGLYHQGNGVDLDHVVEFASGIEIGTELRNGAQVSVLIEHRSNAHLGPTSPSLDMISVLYSVPLQ